MKDFIDDFYSYDFTGILHNDESSNNSDIEIDLESVDVVEDNDEEEADKRKPVSPNYKYIDTAASNLYFKVKYKRNKIQMKIVFFSIWKGG